MRLQGYDYSRAGLYFITIVVKHRIHLFGRIENGIMQLNDSGRMVERWYWEIENKYPDKHCHEMVVMPNHFHCIIENTETDDHVLETDAHILETDAHVGAPLRGRSENNRHPENKKYGMHNQKYNATIGDAMGWFQTMSTNEYIRGVKQHNWQRFDGNLWQRNFYDHIIRNEKSFKTIAEYIINNPKKWQEDKFYNKQNI